MFPGELVDRYTVAKLYTERLSKQHEELRRYEDGLAEARKAKPDKPWDELVGLMYQVNGFIWDFESPVHEGKLDVDPIMAGVLALRVRKLNAVRVALSKLIDRVVGIE